MEELIQKLTDYFGKLETDPETYGDPEVIQEELGGDYLDEITHDEYMEALDKAMQQAGVDEETREQVKGQYDDQVDDYGQEGILEHLVIVVNDQDVTNEITNDNTVEVHGDNKAPIHQSNDTDVANATAEGAVAGGAGNTQAQTGDAGVQAGHDVNNQHGSIDTTSGEGNISADGSTIDGSAFGSGGSNVTATDDNSTNTDVNVEDSFKLDSEIKDSFDYEDNDQVDVTATVDADGYGEHGYEVPTYEEPKYEHEEPKYEEPEVPKYEEPEPDYEYDS